MNVSVSISYSADETMPTATPAEILAALGGDPAKDTISVSMVTTQTPPPVEVKVAP